MEQNLCGQNAPTNAWLGKISWIPRIHRQPQVRIIHISPPVAFHKNLAENSVVLCGNKSVYAMYTSVCTVG
jgi:hypothetical protein